MAGAVGKRVTRGRLSSIVALDPAGPLFTMDRPDDRLHFTDADYVEVQFTDIGRLGFSQPIGHANFYPNYGTSSRDSLIFFLKCLPSNMMKRNFATWMWT